MDLSQMFLLSYKTDVHTEEESETYVGVFTLQDSCNRAVDIANNIDAKGNVVIFYWNPMNKVGELAESAFGFHLSNVRTLHRSGELIDIVSRGFNV